MGSPKVTSGDGSVVASVEVIMRGRGGSLHMRASSTSWVAEVACYLTDSSGAYPVRTWPDTQVSQLCIKCRFHHNLMVGCIYELIKSNQIKSNFRQVRRQSYMAHTSGLKTSVIVPICTMLFTTVSRPIVMVKPMLVAVAS
jgi:hypothetical protein